MGMSTPSSEVARLDEPMSAVSRTEEDDTLHVEKSRVLDQLQHLTTEVERLESRLQAVKRKRARAVISAMERHQKAQETEAQEMRYVLDTIHHMSISESVRNAGVGTAEQDGKVSNRTLFSSMGTAKLSGLTIDMIRKQQNFTNMSFSSIQNHILSTSETGLRGRRYHIAGSCNQLQFNIQFTVHEPSLDLSDVQVVVPRSTEPELGLFISRVKRESMLLPFFQTLSQYAQMDYDRRSLMDKLAKRFPKLIKSNHALRKLPVDGTVLPGGSGVQSLTFRSARSSSPELVLQWTIDVTEHGTVVPRLGLLPRMPTKWRQTDDKGTLDAISTQFIRLVQLKGTEAAVAALLECVYGSTGAAPQ
ncbi:hypothetical protein BGZ67_002756 [Mortierella alpina]|nr:hypothetical protein BGZ67_002756 [Mortierella alpina]